eukprot:5064674-Amphidinium_carterae.2
MASDSSCNAMLQSCGPRSSFTHTGERQPISSQRKVDNAVQGSQPERIESNWNDEGPKQARTITPSLRHRSWPIDMPSDQGLLASQRIRLYANGRGLFPGTRSLQLLYQTKHLAAHTSDVGDDLAQSPQSWLFFQF